MTNPNIMNTEKEQKLKQFMAKMPTDQLKTIYAELLDIKEKDNELPFEITGKMYTMPEAARWIKVSASWVRKKVYDGVVSSHKGDAGKWLISWEGVQELIDIRNKKFK